MNSRGITLIELIVVIAIISILAAALGFSFTGWMSKYKVESQLKELYIDLMNARVRAMQNNRTHFVNLTQTGYTIYEDTNPPPNGNETLETGADTLLQTKSTDYTIISSFSGTSPSNYTFRLDNRGLISRNGTIRLDSTSEPDYDCLVLSPTRMNMGRWNGSTCEVR